jgi:hypothetical protein
MGEFLGAWPTYEGPMADTMNSTPKHVVSSTLENRRWNSTVIDGHRRSSTVIDGHRR